MTGGGFKSDPWLLTLGGESAFEVRSSEAELAGASETSRMEWGHKQGQSHSIRKIFRYNSILVV